MPVMHHLGLGVNAVVGEGTESIWAESGWRVGLHPDSDPDDVALGRERPKVLPFDPAAHTVEDVKAYVGDDYGQRRADVLDLEVDGKNRKTLVEWLAASAPVDEVVETVDVVVDVDGVAGPGVGAAPDLPGLNESDSATPVTEED